MLLKRAMSASAVAFFTNFVLTRYRFSIVLPNIVFGPLRLIQALISAVSFGLFFRTATAMFPPVRSVRSLCSVRPVNTFFQNAAM